MTLNKKREFSYLELANVGAFSVWLVLLNISFVTCSLLQYIQENTILKVPVTFFFLMLQFILMYRLIAILSLDQDYQEGMFRLHKMF